MSAEAEEVSITLAPDLDESALEQQRRYERLEQYMREKEVEKAEKEREAQTKAHEVRKQQRTAGTAGLRETIRNARKEQKPGDRTLKEMQPNENAQPHAQRSSVAFSINPSLDEASLGFGQSKAIRQLEAKVVELQEQLCSRENALQEAQEAYNKLNEELQLSQVKIDEMQEYNEHLEKEIQDHTSLMKAMEKLQDTLKVELETVKSEAHRQYTNLQRELLEFQAKLREAKQELAQTRDELATAEQQLRDGMQRELELARTLDNATAQHKQEREALTAERNELASDLESSRAACGKLSQRLAHKEHELEMALEENSRLNAAIETRKAEEIRLRKEVGRLEEREAQLTADVEVSAATINALHDRIEELQQELQEQQGRALYTISQLQALNAKLQADLEAKAAELRVLQAENSAIATTNASLSKELETVQQEKANAAEEHRTQQASLRSELDAANRRCSEHASELQQKEQDLLAAQVSVTTNEQKMAQLSQQLALTTNELRQCEAQLQAAQEKLQLYELGEKDSNAQRAEYIRRTTALQAEVEKYRSAEQALSAQMAQLQQEMSTSKSQFEQEKAQMQTSLVVANSEADDLRRQLEAMTARLLNAESMVSRLSARELELLEKRRFLNNRVLQLQGNIRVFVRVRPAKPGSPRTGHDLANYVFPPNVRADDKGEIEVSEPMAKASSIGNAQPREKKYRFAFDKVFGPDASQETVYNELSPLVQSVVDGYSVCLLAYGQTSSGKTYTMIGQHEAVLTSTPQLESKDSSDESVALEDSDADSTTSASADNKGGVIVRAAKTLFELLDEVARHGWTGEVTVSVMEVYNDTVRDLTTRSREESNVTIRHNTDGSIDVLGARALPVRSAEDIIRTVRIAMTKRCKKSTRMNADSSRSHCVFQINVRMTNQDNGAERHGTLHVVDLAGSERVRVSGSIDNPELFKEAKCINKSLSALGNVFNAMYRKEKHIPFRDSTITHLLQPCLQRDCKVLLICNVAPEAACLSESISTLRFARKVNETTPSSAV